MKNGAIIKLDWNNMNYLVNCLLSSIRSAVKKPSIKVFPIPNGGKYVAGLLAMKDPLIEIVGSPFRSDVIIDEVYETGKTVSKYSSYKKPSFFLIDKRDEQWKNKWVEFPYNEDKTEKEREDLASKLLLHFGNNSRDAIKFLTKIASTERIENKVK